MHVRVATVQVQPEPESAVTVRPAGGVSVTVTVPLVGEPPTFVTLRVKRDRLPRPEDAGLCARLRQREVASSCRRDRLRSDLSAELLPGFESPPPDTTAPFTSVPAASGAIIAVTVMSG